MVTIQSNLKLVVADYQKQDLIDFKIEGTSEKKEVMKEKKRSAKETVMFLYKLYFFFLQPPRCYIKIRPASIKTRSLTRLRVIYPNFKFLKDEHLSLCYSF